MKLYSAVKHSLHQLKKVDLAPRPKAKQPALGSPRPIRPLEINRSQAGKGRRRAPLPTVGENDCGDQWGEVCKLLLPLEGVQFLDDHSLGVVARLGDDEVVLNAVANAIATLVDAGHSETACTLVRWLQPAARVGLMERCPDHIEKLGACNIEIRRAMDSAQFSAARAALTRQPQDLAEFFRLLSYCSPRAKEQ
jgi:hypothetical protein